jgi:hypothetical protein
MRTTLDLPDPLLKEVKTRAVMQGVKLKDLIASYIETGLRGQNSEPRTAAVLPRGSYPLPVAWEADGSVTASRSNAEIYAILEEEDIASYHRSSNQSEPHK